MPAAPGPPGAEPLLRSLHAHALLVRARGQVAQRGRHQLRRRRLERREGRVAQGHRPDAERLPAGPDRHPHPARRRRPPRRGLDHRRGVKPATASTRPDAGAADVYTLRERLGALDGRSIWIVGDVTHSRVARSNIHAFQKMGAKVTVCGPPTLIPRDIEALGCEVAYTLDGLDSADVVYALRMQHERMTDCSCRACASTRRSTRSTAAGSAPARCSSTGPGEPRRRARRRGDRLAAGRNRPAGGHRHRRPHGGALRAAGGPHRAGPQHDRRWGRPHEPPRPPRPAPAPTC